MHQNSARVNCVARFSAKPPLRSKATQHHLQCYVPLPAIGTNSRPVPEGFKPSEITGSILIHFTCFFLLLGQYVHVHWHDTHDIKTTRIPYKSHIDLTKNSTFNTTSKVQSTKTPHPIGPYTLGWPTLPRLFTCLGSKISTIISHFQLLGRGLSTQLTLPFGEDDY